MRIVDRYRQANYDFTPEGQARVIALEKRGTLTNDSWFLNQFPQFFNQTDANITVNNTNAMGIAAYRRGVELRAQGIAMMPLKLFKDTGSGRVKQDFPLLVQPNPWQSWIEFEVWMNAMAVGRGNGVAFIMRDGSFAPVQLVPIPNPDSLTPKVENGELWYYNTDPNFPKRIPGINIVHYKGMVWDNPLWGISSVRYHSQRLGIMIASEKTEAITSKSGGKKVAISATGAISLETQKLLKDSYDSVLADESSAIVLPPGGAIEELTMSPIDLDMINAHNMSVQDVNRMLGIPNSLNNLDGSTKGSAEQEWQSFYSMTLMYDATRNEAELRRKLLTERQKTSFYFKYSFNSMMRATSSDRIEYMGKAIRGGIMTPETAQDFEELPRTEGSNQTYLDANLIPVSKFEEWIDAKITNLTTKTQPNPNGNNQDQGESTI